MPIRVDTTDAGSIDGSLEGAHGLDVGSTEFPYGVVIVRRADDQRVAIPCQNITGFILTPTNQGR